MSMERPGLSSQRGGPERGCGHRGLCGPPGPHPPPAEEEPDRHPGHSPGGDPGPVCHLDVRPPGPGPGGGGGVHRHGLPPDAAEDPYGPLRGGPPGPGGDGGTHRLPGGPAAAGQFPPGPGGPAVDRRGPGSGETPSGPRGRRPSSPSGSTVTSTGRRSCSGRWGPGRPSSARPCRRRWRHSKGWSGQSPTGWSARRRNSWPACTGRAPSAGEDIVRTSGSKSEVTAAFLALLELCRRGNIHLDGGMDNPWITPSEDPNPTITHTHGRGECNGANQLGERPEAILFALGEPVEEERLAQALACTPQEAADGLPGPGPAVCADRRRPAAAADGAPVADGLRPPVRGEDSDPPGPEKAGQALPGGPGDPGPGGLLPAGDPGRTWTRPGGWTVPTPWPCCWTGSWWPPAATWTPRGTRCSIRPPRPSSGCLG